MRLIEGCLGIDRGEVVPFSDFEDDGPMWAGEGAREVRCRIDFDQAFAGAPVVQLGVTMWDVSNAAAMRLDVSAEAVEATGFVLRVSTWGDSRIARVRVGWTAFGACRDDDVWDVD